jgi:hypothetical protein
MDIESAWKSTCKVLLGEEIGEMKRYSGYLEKYVEPVVPKKSSLSGREVFFSTDDYLPDVSFISQEELGAYHGKFANFKVDINRMKDIDSILEAIGEVAYYCGDAVLGTSQNVQESNRIFNSVNVFRSQEIYDSKYVAFSSVARYSEFLFGSNGIGETKFGIRNYNTYQNTRCFESNVIYNSSDCYYVATVGNCSHCFFCFNLRNRSYSIGNVQLPKEKYFRLREGLLEQIRDELERKKDLPGIIGLLDGMGRHMMKQGGAGKGASSEKINAPARELDSSFAETTRLLLGRELRPLLDYREWLYEHVQRLISVPSAISGEMVHAEPLKYNLPQGAQACFVKLPESLKLAESSIGESEVEGLGLGNAEKILQKIAYFTPEAEVGTNINVTACAAYGYAINALECWWPVKTKNAAYCGWSRQSENTFGCSIIFSSKFCIKCFNSIDLNRCFEVSDSSSSTDCYFCHNVENCHDSMFCFNSKNLRYAVGNAEIGREKYLKLKKVVLDGIAAGLEADKRLDLSIYELGRVDGKNH